MELSGENRERRTKNQAFLEYVDTVVTAIVAVALLSTFAVRVVRVDGHSMEPTLLDGERLITTNFLYDPEHGDIVVIDAYIPHGLPLIKRVIGVAGDTIDIDFEAGVVYRNGQALEEPYTAEPTWTYEGVDFPLTVPDGTLFVMGDNRNHSSDSRLPDIGCVDVRDVLGKSVWRIAPLARMGSVE